MEFSKTNIKKYNKLRKLEEKAKKTNSLKKLEELIYKIEIISIDIKKTP